MMKSNLKKFKITSKKPLPVDDFIEKILYEPGIGYYSSKDPFGKNGDFITSPTISNLFSEIIGIWLISAWEKMGKPKVCLLYTSPSPRDLSTSRMPSSA